jgi:hypothetical protein
MVRLIAPPPDTSAVTLYFNGIAYPMLPEGGVWYSVVGLPTWQEIGSYPMEAVSEAGPLVSGWVEVGDGGFEFVEITIPEGPAGLLHDTARIEEERQRVRHIVSQFTPQRLWSGPWIIPAEGHISSPFGVHRSINGGPYYPHSGTDIANETGTPVHASAAGVVVLAEELFLYGNSIIIDHGAGVFSNYAHLDSLAVSVGDYVEQGRLIGLMGSTGLSSGPHVHWEAIVHGVRTDPMLWVEAPVEP